MFKDRSQKQRDAYKLLPITGKPRKNSSFFLFDERVFVCLFDRKLKLFLFVYNLSKFQCDRFIIVIHTFEWWKRHRQSRVFKFNCSKHQFDHTNVIIKPTASIAVTATLFKWCSIKLITLLANPYIHRATDHRNRSQSTASISSKKSSIIITIFF